MKVLAALVLYIGFCNCAPPVYTLSGLNFIAEPTGVDYRSVTKLAIADINNNPKILPNTTLILDNRSHDGNPAVGLKQLLAFIEGGQNFVIGNPFSSVTTSTGVAASVYDVVQISVTATSTVFSDKSHYPLFTRMLFSNKEQVNALITVLTYYGEVQGRGWDKVALFSSTDAYGLDLSESFISSAHDGKIEISSYQQFLPLQPNHDVELQQIKNSKARVIGLMTLFDYEKIIISANDYGLVGDSYVWIAPDGFILANFTDEIFVNLSRGLINVTPAIPSNTEAQQQFYERLLKLDREEYPLSGNPLEYTSFLGYDAVIVAALALHELDQLGYFTSQTLPAATLTEIIRNQTFEGLTGPISFNEEGDRIFPALINYFSPEAKSVIPSGIYGESTGTYEIFNDIIWFSNTTEIPDLDIREPFHYWSCHNKEKRFDETGKTITLQTPGSSNVDDIDSHYHCDQFIDCTNFSDESVNCSSNYLIVFIIFGIISGVMTILSILIFFFVFIFGIVLGYCRLRVASPFFLLITIISIIIGFISIFSWFGKPHPVACAFQPWLLGLSSMSMITALSAKNFRVWRIFRKQFKKITITDYHLLGLWAVVMAPVVIILAIWTIVSTPTANLEERGGQEHYVCTTGGFTGAPGGYIFFGIFVAYATIILGTGMIISVVSRKVPALFNESKLLAISIYNLAFLCIVIIPVFLIVQPFNPFIAWILRTVAILYAFSVTLILQFAPPILGIILLDRCKDNVDFISTYKRPWTNSSASLA